MTHPPPKVAVLGAGVMGLAAAYHAQKAGYQVTVYEADKVAGGMAAHFDFDGLSLERFYHFVCKTDHHSFTLLEELGIEDSMQWVPTSMGYYIDGKHYHWGDPLSLLRFPLLSLWDKWRYGFTMLRTSKRADMQPLEHISAKDWILRHCGKKCYALLWQRLLELKFYEYTDQISAAWLATRIRRLSHSRRSMMQEELGYIKGGSETLITALCMAIEQNGGSVRTGQPVKQVKIEAGKATAIITQNGEEHACDQVISTIPTPYINAVIPDLPAEWAQRYDAIENIGCVCVVVKLRKSVTPHFWVNVNDPAIPVPGIVEFSNLRPFGDSHIVYLPYYMPQSHPFFRRSDGAFRSEATAILQTLNPQLTEDDITAITIGRLQHAQPVCTVGFAEKIPPVQTPIQGLQIADTCFYYPEDRGISESVHLGKIMAANLPTPSRRQEPPL